MSQPGTEPQLIGPLDVGPIAHGGHCVARHQGRVVFVRDALPGERVLAEVLDARHDRYWRARATTILVASPDRIEPPCPVAGACGGCDFQHVKLPAQRELKARVVAEQLRRLADIEWPVQVVPVPGDSAGLGWRTRMRYLSDGAGRVGLRAWRSDQLVELPPQGCLIADPRGPGVDQLRDWAELPGELIVAVGDDAVAVRRDADQLCGPPSVTQHVLDRTFKVDAAGFWQVHPGAAQILTTSVLEQLTPQAGERALDLYCGVGLFAGALVDAGCRVLGIELNSRAVVQAKQNVPQAEFIAGRLERMLRKIPNTTDLIVLDPPRTGAGRQVIGKLAATDARAISYVACDPAALARDVKTFDELGWKLTQLRAFDLFPMTHHIECVAKLERS